MADDDDESQALVHAGSATQHLENGELDKAEDEITTAIDLDVINSQYYNLRSIVRFQKEDWVQCIDDCDMAVVLENNDDISEDKKPDEEALRDCLVRRGTCHVQLGDLEAARTDFNFALDIDSEAEDSDGLREAVQQLEEQIGRVEATTAALAAAAASKHGAPAAPPPSPKPAASAPPPAAPARTQAAEPAGVCASCGAELAPGAKFCPECGTKVPPKPVTRFCQECGTELRSGAKFCPSCGTKAV
jgi:tetratricopeptide (TPR) repeat protein/RNA polymerase subunit RPABC4/transcription elongation factor Spt4